MEEIKSEQIESLRAEQKTLCKKYNSLIDRMKPSKTRKEKQAKVYKFIEANEIKLLALMC